MKLPLYLLLLPFCLFILSGCTDNKNPGVESTRHQTNSPFIVVLGIAQDAGYPQIGCNKDCCKKAWMNPSLKKFPTSLALVDPANKKWWLFEATPDIKDQLQLFRSITDSAYNFLPDGIFLTHGHIGHYTGLMQLGREAMNSNNVPVYTMPRMKNYLITNGPWSQLVSLQNILLQDMVADSIISLTNNISISPFLVPHRDEFTETVGFSIKSGDFKTVFIPDIDKWNKFDRNIVEIIKQSSLALLDGTFYKDGELPGRAMNEIPHPFIEESILLFDTLPADDKKKIRFIHFNHTNPLLNESSDESRQTRLKGFTLIRQGEILDLD